MITSEIKQLESMLAEIPIERAIERIGLESRLENARQRIDNIDPEALRHRAVITFRGQPVVGSHGIVADFAAKATDKFSEAVAAIAAALTDNLRYMGAIPNRKKNHLLITGTAVGSFGFEFEVPKADENSLFPGSSDAEVALEKMQELFSMSIDGNDDSLTELVDEIHPRAVKKAVEFLETLQSQNAWCAMSFKESSFRFSDISQVQYSIQQLSSENIREDEESFTGELQGVLPASRTFEFKTADEIIKGKIGPDIVDPDILNQKYLHQRANIVLYVTQVGEGRPRYTLEQLEHIVLS